MSGFGSPASPRALPSRCRSPPLNSSAGVSTAWRGSPTVSINSDARCRRVFLVPIPRMSRGSVTIWAAGNRGLRLEAGSWKMRWTSACVAFRPSTRISPEVGVSKSARHRASVDLPEPDGPTSPSVCPRSRLKVTSRIAAWPAKLLLSPRTLRKGSAAMGGSFPEHLPRGSPFHDAAGLDYEHLVGGSCQNSGAVADEEERGFEFFSQLAKQR